MHHPGARRQLNRPVISVGNLVAGGSGKTPVVAALANLLRDAGERPAILSRGYARRGHVGGTVVVSDGARVLEPVERSGDEPQMLARTVPGVPVIVSADRYAAGRIAESRFGSTVMLLDDGFQHLQLARDVDLLLTSPIDLSERILPLGALREPIAAARAAHALLVPGTPDEVRRMSAVLGVNDAFVVATRYEAPRLVAPYGDAANRPVGRRVVAVAGIARPQRFFAALRQQGWEVLDEMVFRDHHWFSARDLIRAADTARRASADFVMTTEKDAMRLPPSPSATARQDGIAVSWAYLPMRVEIQPTATFAAWILGRLAMARRQHGVPSADAAAKK